MALEARDYSLQEEPLKKELEQSAVIIEFPRILTEEEKLEIRQENLKYIQDLSLEQDWETIEKAQIDMEKNPNKRLVDLYFKGPNKKNPDFSRLSQPETDWFGKVIFRHNQTRYIP